MFIVKKIKLPHILFIIYIAIFLLCAYKPYDFKVWFFENLTVLVVVIPLVVTYRTFRFSNTAYVLMFVWIIMHTIGGHFVFKNVPFDFVNNMFGWERNNYDRFAHFAVGFYAFPIAEILHKKGLVNSKVVLFLFPVFAIFTVASVYEIIEWIAASNLDPKAGLDYVSAQGDIWDAQKDMLCDGIGSVLSTVFYFFKNRLY